MAPRIPRPFTALVAAIAVSAAIHGAAMHPRLRALGDAPGPSATGAGGAPPSSAARPPRGGGTGRRIHDPTLPWDEAAPRPWLDPSLPDPPAMLLLTSLGWNHPDVAQGLRHPRSLMERNLYTALVNHPWFHPTGWDDLEAGRLPVREDVRYYVFLDVNQCNEPNWPHYGTASPAANADRERGRAVAGLGPASRVTLCGSSKLDEEILRGRVFRLANNATVVGEAAAGGGEAAGRRAGAMAKAAKGGRARGIQFDLDRLRDKQSPPPAVPDRARLVLLACVRFRNQRCPAAARRKARRQTVWLTSDGRHAVTYPEDGDQGLLHPPLAASPLTAAEERDIRTCAAERLRRHHAVYLGNFRGSRYNRLFEARHGIARANYLSFHDGNWTVVASGLTTARRDATDDRYVTNLTYGEVLRQGQFLLAPRGDNKFSFRLAEALQAGGIPVCHADDYLFPFRPEVVDWGRCAVILPERDAGARALAVLAAMTEEERCRRRNYCYFGVYKRYVETFAGQMTGYVKGLEGFYRRSRENRTVEYAGILCNESSITSLDCNPV